MSAAANKRTALQYWTLLLHTQFSMLSVQLDTHTCWWRQLPVSSPVLQSSPLLPCQVPKLLTASSAPRISLTIFQAGFGSSEDLPFVFFRRTKLAAAAGSKRKELFRCSEAKRQISPLEMQITQQLQGFLAHPALIKKKKTKNHTTYFLD